MLLFCLPHVLILMSYAMLLCHAMPLYALVCSFHLMMHYLWIFPLRLLTFCRSTLMSFQKIYHQDSQSTLMSFQKIYHQDSHHFVALSTRSTSFPAHSFRTA